MSRPLLRNQRLPGRSIQEEANMATAERFSAADTRAELEQAFRDIDHDQANGAFAGPAPLDVAIEGEVAFAIDHYEEQGTLTGAEAEELSAFATLAAIRAAREAIVTAAASWVAGKEGVR
jgi:hypothetical protein